MNQQDRRTDVGGRRETAAMPVDARPALEDLIARLHREVRTETEWLRLVADSLAAERDRADQAEAVIARALYICHNYGTRDPLPANLYKTLKPYEETTAWREATA